MSTGVWGTLVKGHIGDGAHWQWGTWAMGVQGQCGTGIMGHISNGHMDNRGTGGMGTWAMGHMASGTYAHNNAYIWMGYMSTGLQRYGAWGYGVHGQCGYG